MKAPGEHSSLSTAAYSVVRERILRGEIGLGQVISRRKLAVELHMSFLPVSEALLRLEFEGLLESRPRAGTRVRIPSPEDVTGHYVVREALEAQAAMRFTQVATDAERAEMQERAVRVDALASGRDRAVYVVEHQALHARIAEYARCAALLEAIEKRQALASTWFCVMRQPNASDSTRRHQELVQALCSGDQMVAADAVRRHIAVGMEHALEILEPYFALRQANGRTFHRSERSARRRFSAQA